MKILVCDDKADQGEETFRNVRDGVSGFQYVTVERCFGTDLGRALEALRDRIEQVEQDPTKIDDGNLVFDDCDLVLLDNNLTSLTQPGPFLTAEAVIAYIRAFTGARYLVSLNKNPTVDFDLQHLVGDRETRADIALNTRHLSNRGLWAGEQDPDSNRFLPWYWPRLLQVGEQRARQIDFVETNLDKPILSALGLAKDEFVPFMSRHAKSLLSLAGDDHQAPFASVTFRDVFKSMERLYPDTEARHAYAKEDRFRTILARALAAGLDRWFRLDLLGPQEVLVDLPHLIQRMPFLLGADAADITSWNRAITTPEQPFGLVEGQGAERVIDAVFQSQWTDRPVFVWTTIKNDPTLQDFFYGSDAEWASGVFCEDISRFVSSEANPQSFVVDLDGSWRRRYVKKLPGYGYRPDSYLAL